eukprot:1136799-Prorocentrum_minimum.AAC.1
MERANHVLLALDEAAVSHGPQKCVVLLRSLRLPACARVHGQNAPRARRRAPRRHCRRVEKMTKCVRKRLNV